MKKISIVLLSIFFLSSCSIEKIDENVCLNGTCNATFVIDVKQNPGSYQDESGVWHIKYSGINYFRIKGIADELTSNYIINGVPLIETSYDSNYFYTLNNITWTYPVYSFLGLFTNNNLTNPIPIGFKTFTMLQIVDDTSVSNLAGYEINKHFHFDHPAASTMLQTYSRYNYLPTQHMAFFPDMIGDEAQIYIRVLWGESIEKIYVLRVKFESR